MTTATSASDGDLIGRKLGDFVVRERIGQGGFGTVYRCEQPLLAREAVIKVLRPDHRDRPELTRRFLREAKLASRLDHPYASHVYAFGAEPDGLLWIAMELVRGMTLADLLGVRALPLGQLVPLLERVCEVVQTAHDQGIVHRDLKPTNIMVVARSGRLFPKLLDFGIGKLVADGVEARLARAPTPPPVSAIADATPLEARPAGASAGAGSVADTPSTPVMVARPPSAPPVVLSTVPVTAARADADTALDANPAARARPPVWSDPDVEVSLTHRGAALGSPLYMAPEQWEDAGQVEPRSDQYALAVVAYEALTGSPPFLGATATEVYHAHMSQPPPSLGPGFPAALDAVLARALAKRPAERFASVLELATEVRRASGLEPDAAALPGLDARARATTLALAPQPIAESVAAIEAARNPHQARDAHWQLVHTVVRYLALYALACSSRLGSSGADAFAVREALRSLHRRTLTDREWLDLARVLTRAWAARRDAYPLPGLVDFFHAETGRAPAAVIDELIDLREAPAERTSSPDALTTVLERSAAKLSALLDALTFLTDFPLVVTVDGGRAEPWMGVRRAQRPTVMVRGERIAPGLPVLLDSDAAPVLALAPVFAIAAPSPGEPRELFLLDGPGRTGARLVAPPSGFERHDPAVWDWVRDQLAVSLDAEESRVALERAPYRGLAAFAAEDSAVFFGREREVEATVNRLVTQPLIAVVGPSGAGKSSFVQAGVIPALTGWRAITLRPGPAPLAALAARLAVAGIGDGDAAALRDRLAADPDALGAALRRDAAQRGRILIVVDQLEEAFTLGADAEDRRLFLAAIAAAARAPDDPVRVMVTLRDDFLVRAEQVVELRNRLGHALQLLAQPSPEDVRRIVSEPARRASYEFEDPGLVDEMVAAVADRPGALALVSFTAAQLWELRDRHFRRLTRSAYGSIGGVGGALATHAEHTLEAMPGDQRRVARAVFRRLVTSDNTRAVVPRAELHAEIGDAAAADAVIEHLVSARLVITTDDDAGGDRIELVHEALIAAWPRLVDWLREDADRTRFREQLRAAAAQWHERGRARGLLWRGDALADLARWRREAETPLSDVEAAFADASASDAARGRRVRTGIVIGAFAVLAVVAIVLYATRAQTRSAQRRAEASDARSRSQLAELQLEHGRQLFLAGDPLRAIVHLQAAADAGANDASLRYLLARTAEILGKRRHDLVGHTGIVRTGVYTADGSQLVTAGEDGTARLWDVATGREVRTFTGHTGRVWHLELSPDGTRLLTAGEDGTARLWDVATGAAVHVFTGHTSYIFHARFSPDGARVVTSGADGTARVWNAAAGTLIHSLDHGAAIGDAWFTADGKTVYTVGNDGALVRWDASTGVRRSTVADAAVWRAIVRVTRDGATFATADSEGRVTLWSAATGERQRTIDVRHPVSNVVFSADGAAVATWSADEVEVWRVATGEPIAAVPRIGGEVQDAQLAADASRIAVATADGNVRIWSMPGGEQLAILPTVDTFWVAFAPSGDEIATGGGGASLWSTATDLGARVFELGQSVNSVSLRSDGGAVAACGSDGTIRVWSATDGAVILTGQHGARCVAAFASDGRVISAGDDGALAIWTPGSPPVRWEGTIGPVEAIAISPDDRSVATVNGAAIRIRSVATGAVEHELAGHTKDAIAVAWSPDGRTLASCGIDRTVRAWSIARGGDPRVLALGGTCFSLRWTGPDQLLIAASPGDVRSWSPVAGVDRPVIDAGVRVSAAHSLSDGLSIVTSWDGTASIWDFSRARMVDRLVHGAPVLGADTAAAGSVFATLAGTQIVVWHRPVPVSRATVRSFVDAGPYRLAESGQLVKRGH